jgi:hypothetical protein
MKRCPGALFCAITPHLTINYLSLSNIIMNWTCPNPSDGTSEMMCQVTKTLTSITEKSKWDRLVRTIHTALLQLNIRHFLNNSSGTFMTLDDSMLRVLHRVSKKEYYFDIEVPYDEIKATYLNAWYRPLLEKFFIGSTGIFSLALTFLKDTKVDVMIKNGADFYISVDVELLLNFYTISNVEKGKKYMINVTTTTSPARGLFVSVKLQKIQVTKVGALTEVKLKLELLKFPLQDMWFVKSVIGQLLSNQLEGAGPNFKINLTENKFMSVTFSLPPSDEPLHPCIGLLFDRTNISYGLACTSSVTGAPSLWGKLLRILTPTAKDLIPYILNKIHVQLGYDEASMATVWSAIWTPQSLQPKFIFEQQDTAMIKSALASYLWRYKHADEKKYEEKIKTQLEESTAAKLLDLANKIKVLSQRATEWSRADVNMENFNVKYAEYLFSLLPEGSETTERKRGHNGDEEENDNGEGERGGAPRIKAKATAKRGGLFGFFGGNNG